MAAAQQANKENNMLSQKNRKELLVVDTLAVPKDEQVFFSIKSAARFLLCDPQNIRYHI